MKATDAPTASVLGDIADLVSAVVWPLLILGVLWFLRKPIYGFADRIGTSAQRLTIGTGGLSVQLSAAIQPVPNQATTALADVRQPEQAQRVVGSGARAMFQQLEYEEPAPYLVVDLGEGREWLTSRLYIFSVLLRAVRQTHTLVFVETLGGVRGRLVGLAAPGRVRYGLAHAYPWLEADYAAAFAGSTEPYRTGKPNKDPFVLDDGGRLARNTASAVASAFLSLVQQNAPPPTVTEAPEWVIEARAPGPRFAEHATWLTGGDLERVLGDALRRFAYLTETVPQLPVERARAAVRLRGEDVVALVDDEHRFRDMIVNRREVLEALAPGAISEPDDNSTIQRGAGTDTLLGVP
jgi:hypothetical protein